MGSTSMPVDWVFVRCELLAFTDLGLWMGMPILTLEQLPSPSIRKR